MGTDASNLASKDVSPAGNVVAGSSREQWCRIMAAASQAKCCQMSDCMDSASCILPTSRVLLISRVEAASLSQMFQVGCFVAMPWTCCMPNAM